jgi:hypothetical protein
VNHALTGKDAFENTAQSQASQLSSALSGRVSLLWPGLLLLLSKQFCKAPQRILSLGLGIHMWMLIR